jgi:enterobactin synthetase component F
MLSLPDVAQAVAHACVFNQAAATGGDARQLVGYVVSESGLPLDRAALLESLKAQLPPHMVPVVLLQISALPLSANGKLDRKALPLPELTSKTSGRAPQTETEMAVAQAFAGLLGCEVNDIEADFFALGGHSLLAMRLAAQLSRAFTRKVTPGQIMVASTVSKLSTLLDSQMSDEQAQRLGYETFCRCVKAMARRCSASIRRPVLPGSLACWRAISARAGQSPAFSRRDRKGRCSSAPIWMA